MTTFKDLSRKPSCTLFVVLLQTILLICIFRSTLPFSNGIGGHFTTTRSTQPLFSSSTTSAPSLAPNNLHSPTDLTAWSKLFKTCKEETCQVIETKDLPVDLEGTYYRNGGAKYDIGADKVLHPFDADGMIAALTIQDQSLIFRNRYVRTKGFLREKKAGRALYRNAFGSQRRGGPLANIFDVDLKNIANTNVIYWANRLYALWEGGMPYALEADSLRTLGESSFRGALEPGSRFSAHPRVDAKTGRLINYTIKHSLQSCTLTIFEFDQEMKVVNKISTEAPMAFDLFPFLLGVKGPAQCIRYEPNRPAMIHIVPRNGSPAKSVPVEAHFNFHFANAYEDQQSGNIELDVIWCKDLVLGELKGSGKAVWEDLDYGKEVPYSKLVRYSLSAVGDTFKASLKQLSTFHMDFPTINPAKSCQKHRYIFALAGSDLTQAQPVRGLLKIDLETNTESYWFGEAHEFLSEPVFAMKKDLTGGGSGSTTRGEDDGYLLSILFNGRDETAEFVVFDGLDVAKGPVSRVPLPYSLSFGLHGTFEPGLVYKKDDVIRRWKAVNAIENKKWNEMKGGFSGLGLAGLFDE